MAELAGTTVNAVRFYHRSGLLEEPERRSNGYKQYRVRHLVRLLRIRRLRDLGVPLSRIGAVDAEGDEALEALQVLDAELQETIQRLQRARAEVAAILEHRAPAGVPAGFETVAPLMSEADRSIVSIYGQLYDEQAMADVQRMIARDTDGESRAMDQEFADLPEDADEACRQGLAERLAPALATHLTDYPWLTDPRPHLSRGQSVTDRTITEAMAELYTPAQRDVLRRVLLTVRAHHAQNDADPQPGQ
ncbi:MerR family transcriptional regulator [Citricoccus sp. K5]|uniref:helix-turn-helix domain-containing protein n=1 Tax=Citricoccus sp. K5 TaxID=2653135 RepID=UPI001F1F8A81|nr:MerR family transcriptional regulator [Citricoccus sp. K5]